ncbi:MAG TPA: rhodanese-like domain-containing protein [Gaiellaceae bacterium]|nr:rhodanese-like domain-containing protein [Gaiellaceae bacterium]
MVRTLAELLAEAEARVTRFTPQEAYTAMADGALLVDLRSQPARDRDGIVPGSLHIPRTVLEWRVALDSDWRSPFVGGPDEQIVLLCDDGYSSLLAAETLAGLGFARVGDVLGGFAAWKDAGLTTTRPRAQPVGVLPGMSGPEF